VRPRRSSIILTYIVVLWALLSLILLVVLPVPQAYYALDSGEYGHSKLAATSKLALSRQDLEKAVSGGVVIVEGRGEALTADEASAILQDVKEGDVVIVYGPWNTTGEILEYIGFKGEYLGQILDPVEDVGDPGVIVASIPRDNYSIVLSRPYAVNLTPIGSGVVAEPLAFSSPFSYIDENGNNRYDVGEPIGESVVAYRVLVGKGEILVFCAEGFLTNSVFDYNIKWLTSTYGNRAILLDQSWTRGNPLLYIKLLVYATQGVAPIYVSSIALVLLLVAVYVHRFSVGEGW